MTNMYLPDATALSYEDSLTVVAQVGAGHFVTVGENGPNATFLPFVVDGAPGDLRIRAHFAKANPHWREVRDATQVLIIVHLADDYVSPGLYPSKVAHGKVVPTWNYVQVQLRGTPSRITDDTERSFLDELTNTNEAVQQQPWSIDDAPEEYIAAERRSIVSFQILVSDVQGKAKVSKNRDDADAAAVYEHFSAGSPTQQLLSEWMNRP